MASDPSAGLSGSGVGDLLVDRDGAIARTLEALRTPGVHLLVAEQGMGLHALVEACRDALPDMSVGRCHTGDLFPVMAPLLEAFGLRWPPLVSPHGLRVTDADVAWHEEPTPFLQRALSAGVERPVMLLDAQEADPAVVEVLVEVAGRVAAGSCEQSIVVATLPWRDRSPRHDWLDALDVVAASRLELHAATPEATDAWLTGTLGVRLPASGVHALTGGNPLLVGLTGRALMDGRPLASAFDLAALVDGLSEEARAVALVLAVADLVPLPPEMSESDRLARMVGVGPDEFGRALEELSSSGVVRFMPSPAGGRVVLTDPMWSDAVWVSTEAEAVDAVRLAVVEAAIAAGVQPARVAVHLAGVVWSRPEVCGRLQRAVLAADEASVWSRLEWLDVLDQECVEDGLARNERLVARLALLGEWDGSSGSGELAGPARVSVEIGRYLAETDPDPGRRARRAVAMGLLAGGRVDDAVVELLDLREQGVRGAARASLTTDLALCYLLAGRTALAERSASEVWSDRRASPEVRVAAGSMVALLRAMNGDLAAGSDICDEVVAMLGVLSGGLPSPVPVRLFAATVRFWTDRFDEALALAGEGFALSEGRSGSASAYQSLVAAVHHRRGSLDGAVRAAEAAGAAAQLFDGLGVTAWWSAVRVLVASERGEDASPWLEECRALTGSWGAEVAGLAVAEQLERDGRPGEAAVWLCGVIDRCRRFGAVARLSQLLPIGARLAVEAGDDQLRSMVSDSLELDPPLLVSSRLAESLAASAWLRSDPAAMRSALGRADAAGTGTLARRLAVDGVRLAQRCGDQSAEAWFLDEVSRRR
jgi:hypothetical protein